MGWKGQPYWLKGAIILASIFIISLLITMYLDSKFQGHPGLTTFPLFPVLLYSSASTFGSNKLNLMPFIVAIPLIFYLVFGAIIGWIYGKIKGKQV